MIALLDANLFVPTWIIDPLLSLAEAGLCEPACDLQGLSDGHGGGLGAV